jgi:hypothetical protein
MSIQSPQPQLVYPEVYSPAAGTIAPISDSQGTITFQSVGLQQVPVKPQHTAISVSKKPLVGPPGPNDLKNDLRSPINNNLYPVKYYANLSDLQMNIVVKYQLTGTLAPGQTIRVYWAKGPTPTPDNIMSVAASALPIDTSGSSVTKLTVPPAGANYLIAVSGDQVVDSQVAAKDLLIAAAAITADPTLEHQHNYGATDYPGTPWASGTKCNYFLQDLDQNLQGSLDPSLNGQANDIFSALEKASQGSSPTWTSLGFQEGNIEQRQKALTDAVNAANEGKLVVVAYENPKEGHSGHVAVVMPGTASTKAFGNTLQVPMIAQAGNYVFSSGPLNAGFGQDKLDDMEVFVQN